jgi:hypothetical protein
MKTWPSDWDSKNLAVFKGNYPYCYGFPLVSRRDVA